MNKVVSTAGIPVKLWLDDIEPGALKQAENLALLPFAFKHIAIMPDAHQGYGMPIGGVLATKGVVIPNAVGVDIGCGMCAVRTNLQNPDKEGLKKVMQHIRDMVPVGFRHHADAQDWDGFDLAPDLPIIRSQLDSARYQLGTLGGGNHFMEVQIDTRGYVWLMLHSGSRNFGLKIANAYHNTASQLCKRWYSALPDPDLAFLPMETDEAKEYMAAMEFALMFAKESRSRMMAKMMLAVSAVYAGARFGDMINVHHNYARCENHFGENVIVHRKGATSARFGEEGIIPGSQGTMSHIVLGMGNEQSFKSCSHGAGRKMGRKEACRSLNLDAEIKLLDDAGVIHGIRTVADLDEASGAYKDINVVMENQKDLVTIIETLRPLGVVKG